MKAPEDSRFYGGSGTWHGTTKVNVETDKEGRVVSVWFRCCALPFDQTVVEESRATEMREMYKRDIPLLVGVQVSDMKGQR